MADYKPTRLECIVRCVDEMEALKDYPDPKNCVMQALGQLDWLEELHRILYEDKEDGAANRMGVP
jgi:hypothetical protein